MSRYFEKISEFDGQGFDGFFVTALAVGSEHLIQMSSGTDQSGKRFYEFDMPVTFWSESHAEPVMQAALQRGRTPVRNDAGDMGFLDIKFTDKPALEDFSTHVVTQVFGLPPDTQFEISWG